MTNESQDQNEQQAAPEIITPAKTSTLMGPRAKLAFAFVLVAAALAYFAFTAFEGATVSYLTVAQASAESPTAVDRQVGVSGKLVQDSYVRDADGITAYFAIKDEDGIEELHVTYKGEIGQVFFNDHSEIILQGQKMVDGSFNADNLTVRCPSKYLTEAEQAEIDAQNDGSLSPPPYQPDYFDQEA
jgi:cytochrome c-type biogenesis protein CcmE